MESENTLTNTQGPMLLRRSSQREDPYGRSALESMVLFKMKLVKLKDRANVVRDDAGASKAADVVKDGGDVSTRLKRVMATQFKPASLMLMQMAQQLLALVKLIAEGLRMTKRVLLGLSRSSNSGINFSS
ncbi:uncharacterized protein A4U43_C05F23300 [Asparagus officinalis]|uniref:Uncharacterized protein n=1 Tax=Asparagus officinalis TaxID=4686 RepID=A0A5P1EY98_ASPOF|nr:uncharacterized protein A4U43_C05F23300 [Asparagus officinalis]